MVWFGRHHSLDCYPSVRATPRLRVRLSALNSYQDIDRVIISIYYSRSMKTRIGTIGSFSWLVTLSLLMVLVDVATATKKPPLKPININIANSEELQQVPGIGPATADKILQTRKSYGTFKSVDDLLAIKGIGKKRLEKMRKYLTVSKATAVNRTSQPPVSAHPQKRPDPISSAPQSTEAEQPPI
jgi:competence ComEA-like helix-hairpin-helix protein